VNTKTSIKDLALDSTSNARAKDIHFLKKKIFRPHMRVPEQVHTHLTNVKQDI